MRAGPTIRTVYQFICSRCGVEFLVRWPFNPMAGTPELLQSVPEGWSVVLDGSNSQTPRAFCGCQAGVTQ